MAWKLDLPFLERCKEHNNVEAKDNIGYPTIGGHLTKALVVIRKPGVATRKLIKNAPRKLVLGALYHLCSPIASVPTFGTASELIRNDEPVLFYANLVIFTPFPPVSAGLHVWACRPVAAFSADWQERIQI